MCLVIIGPIGSFYSTSNYGGYPNGYKLKLSWIFVPSYNNWSPILFIYILRIMTLHLQ